ncbi:MAG: phosphate acyltransferase PlsX [Peptococcaceae bacterium]|nr:phosphate acyltransferase PlsX [Peptococcaceae bacterium]
MIISVDAMGGDNAPREIVAGACHALKTIPSIEKIILVGDQEKINAFIDDSVKKKIEIVHTSEIIEMDEHPAQAYRQKKKASICVASRLVKEGRADAVVSAGSTGAQLVTGLFEIGRLRGIKRPAIATTLPTLTGTKILVDAGANTEVTVKNLEQFALMGYYFAKALKKEKKDIQVALINNGTEYTKGTPLTQEAYQVLKNNPKIPFYGNIEGNNILTSPVDVLVCDGFTGNIVLKTCEGAAKGLFKALVDTINTSIRFKLGALLLKPGLKNIMGKYNSKAIGGSPLLGLNGISIVCHGNSDKEAFSNGIKLAVQCVDNDLVNQIKQSIVEE